MFKKTLLAAVAGLALAFTGMNLASAADWTATSTNTAKVTNDGRITTPTFEVSVFGSAANIASGASTSATFNALSPALPTAVPTVELVSNNSGVIANVGVITDPLGTLTYGTSFTNGAIGASSSFTMNLAAGTVLAN